MASSLGAISAERATLVIANQSYSSAPLDTPEADAKAMAARFHSAGYRVRTVVNLGQADFYQAVDRFFAENVQAKVIAFYYAGHAVQLNGKNFLIPVDADRNAPDVLSRLFDIRHLLAKLSESRAETKIVILDACRDSLFSSHPSASSGLSELIAPSGTFVAFSTAPGATAEDGEGENSPYTAALVQSIFRPGVKIEDAFKDVRRRVRQETKGQQTPWESTSLIQDFSIAGKGAMLKTSPSARSNSGGQAAPVVADRALPVTASGTGLKSACSRILAKLSLGMEALSENDNQTLAGCRQ